MTPKRTRGHAPHRKQTVEQYQARLVFLEKIVMVLSEKCGCSIAQIMSGHLIDCHVPEIRKLREDGGL